MIGQHARGAASKAKGKVEEELGRLSGDRQQQVQGRARQVQGGAQGLLGDVQEAVSKFDWPTIDLSSIDVGRALTGTAAAAHIGRRARRPRWPLGVGGLIAAGLASWVVLSNEALRARLARGVGAIRERIAVARTNRAPRVEIDPIAFPMAETAPIKAAPFKDDAMTEATGYPTGLGLTHDGETPVFGDARSAV